jgi:hypothetical protein
MIVGSSVEKAKRNQRIEKITRASLMNAEPGGQCPQIRWTLGELCEQVQLHSGKKYFGLPERIGDIEDTPRICSLGLLHVQCFPDMQHHV